MLYQNRYEINAGSICSLPVAIPLPNGPKMAIILISLFSPTFNPRRIPCGPYTRTPGMSENTRWLLTLCLAQCFIMLVFINYSAILPLLVQEWGMNNTMAGSIFSVYQLGYIASGVILSVLTDRLNTRNIF